MIKDGRIVLFVRIIGYDVFTKCAFIISIIVINIKWIDCLTLVEKFGIIERN